MSGNLRIGLFIGSFIALVFVVVSIVKKKLNIKYSIVWFLWALLLLVMSIFPQTFYELSHLLGIEMPVNAVFLIMIGLLYALTFYSYLLVSKHNKEIIDLTYQVSALKKKLEEKDEK